MKREEVAYRVVDVVGGDTERARHILLILSDAVKRKKDEYVERFGSGANTGFVQGLNEAEAFLYNVSWDVTREVTKEKEVS